jgi:hypothetical protein
LTHITAIYSETNGHNFDFKEIGKKSQKSDHNIDFLRKTPIFSPKIGKKSQKGIITLTPVS